MELRQEQHLKQTQRLVITAMLQQAIQLLPLSRLELLQRLQQELVENPFLEEVPTGEDGSEGLEGEAQAPESPEREVLDPEIDWAAYFGETLDLGYYEEDLPERPSLEATLSRETSLSEHLLWQLSLSAAKGEDRTLGVLIIGNLSEEGYFQGDLGEIAQEAGTTAERAAEALKLIQSFDPSGVGARSLPECLRLQLESLGAMNPILDSLLNHHLDRLEDRYFPKIARTLGVGVSEVAAAARLIRGLDPYPGLRYQRQRAEYIYPDAYVVKMGDEYQVYLNEDGLPRLRINGYYRGILRQEAHDSAHAYLSERFKSALWLIRSIEQRRQTLLKVCRSIVRFQRDFLDRGIEALRPLVLRDVAEDIQMHESTVSRVTAHKYLHTPQGIFELKFFFHGGIKSATGESRSSVSVKEQIRHLVEEEDPLQPFTDQRIGEMLKARDILIARRTVTKYRKDLKIPPAGRRKRVCL